MDRDESVMRLQQWLTGAVQSETAAAALDPAGLALAGEVSRSIDDTDAEAWALIGRVHLLRFQEIADDDQRELACCLAAYELVRRHAPKLVPEPIGDALDELPFGPRPVGPHALRSEVYSGQAKALLRQGSDGGGTGLIEEAIALLRDAVRLDPEGDGQPERLMNLAGALKGRYDDTGAAADLDEAISIGRQAFALLPPGDPDVPAYLSNLGTALASRFEANFTLSDADEAVDQLRRAEAGMIDDLSSRGTILSNLASALHARFWLTGIRADLHDAVAALTEAVDLTVDDEPGRARCLSNLSGVLSSLYQLDRTAADLGVAIAHGREAAALTPPGHPGRPAVLRNLAGVLRVRFERDGDDDDIGEAISISREALESVGAAHRDAGRMFDAISLALISRFERYGSTADLDEAIDNGRAAAAAAPGSAADLAHYLTNLAGVLLARYERSGELSDLDEAIAHARRAAMRAVAGTIPQATILSNLGTMLSARFERSLDRADVDDAIAVSRTAISLTGATHPDRPGYLSNLGIALRVRFENAADPDMGDLDETISVSRRAVAAARACGIAANEYQVNLAIALNRRFEHTAAADDLDEAVTILQQAIGEQAAAHPNSARLLANLGNALVARYEHSHAPDDWAEAVRAYAAGARLGDAAPMARAYCARRWAALSAEQGRWDMARTAAAIALDLLPQLTDQRLTADDRRVHLASLQGLGPLAAYAQVADADSAQRRSRAGRAWQALEVGRAVLVTRALETRTDLSALRQTAPEIADDIAELCHRLNNFEPAAVSWGRRTAPANASPRERDPGRRRADATRLERLYERVRAIGGFEEFGRPPAIDDLRAATGEGTAVAVLVTPFGCGALIIDRHGEDYLPLPLLTEAHVRERAEQLLTAVTPAGAASGTVGEAVHAVLEWAWDAITGPVLAHLGHQDPPQEETWPRVWWIPTGALALVPLHAAGHHRNTGPVAGRAVLDLVVSSYSPTLRLLAKARQPVRRNTNPLVVGVNRPAYDTSNLRPLTFAEDEAMSVHAGLGSAHPCLVGPAATHDEILRRLPEAGWSHFACHAQADDTDPARGYLALHDRRLEMRELSRLDVQGAHLAYLSSCNSAATPQHLLDEPVHLVSAFLMAGYRHAVGSLWPIGDYVASTITDDTYRAMLEQHHDPAQALHLAIQRLRTQPHALDRPQVWASHIHFGP
ncbi:CHAT domain-containing protein [Solwaraspora sp. WMMA2065]|uniref:CHAT domain-containing protein n=1 Tax=Solwaraspora sp. WMMA2065 TaxID=3015166 RepID=UPI00259BED10|nr:CHAT domain-containing protein [Solwaraspora sp. WMMA2065]WJK33087.1 CHAT domain-containing protein [Solwaraspora sp. WMMA2065]